MEADCDKRANIVTLDEDCLKFSDNGEKDTIFYEEDYFNKKAKDKTATI